LGFIPVLDEHYEFACAVQRSIKIRVPLPVLRHTMRQSGSASSARHGCLKRPSLEAAIARKQRKVCN
jgi:hypothetical protein